MKVRLVHSAADGSVASGGDLYDSRLCAALRDLGHDARVVPEPEPGAVHLFDGLHAARWAPLVRTLPGKKVALVHQPLASLGLDNTAEAAFLAGCDAIQFVSARAESQTRSPALPPSWIAVPGIDHFTPRPSTPARRLVSIGHVIPGKGPLEALELVASLPGEWHLDWLGALDVDAAFARAVLARRDALGLARRVTFHGRVDVAPFLARASGCLATSRGESWGLGLAEALRAGVPVIGTTSAGVLDFVGGAGSRTTPRSGLKPGLNPQRPPGLPPQPPPGLSELVEDRPHEGSSARDGVRTLTPTLSPAGERERDEIRGWLTRLLDDAPEARTLRAEAQAAGALLPSWAECATTTARALEALCAR